MPSLVELSDYYPQQDNFLPVEQPYRGVNLGPIQPITSAEIGNTTAIVPPQSPDTPALSNFNLKAGNAVDKILNRLTGSGGEERYQLWPEKVVREALSSAGDTMREGTIAPGLRREDYTDKPAPDGFTVAASPQDKLIEGAQAISALAGTGGLAGADATLGSTAFLRPALKYENKIYKAPMGGQHLDALPEHLADTFQKQAMSGEDISNFNFGFMNHKGQFLDREKALDYAIKEGLVDPSAGQYGALTSTLMADSSKPGMAIEAMAKAQPFYSALEHNVNQISQNKMTGDQWLGTLVNKPGVKPEELQWTGTQEFLKERGNQPVTKAELQEHLQNNKVELKEVDKIHDPLFENLEGEDAFPNSTKYSSYQLPGGSNYQEKLLTLPTSMQKYNEFIRDIRAKHGEGGLSKLPLTEAELKTYETRLAAAEKDESFPAYQSSHWDEPNILAHVRMNDRVIDGKKSLHIEEIQSDWHQQGRDRGYKTDTKTDLTPLMDAQDAARQALSKGIADSWLRHSKGLASNYREAMDALPNEAAIIKSEVEKYQLHDKDFNKLKQNAEDTSNAYYEADRKQALGVPDAPFKKSWHELALKRMIREAAENGYDRLSWTPGEAQAARYDLSKSIRQLKYDPKTHDVYAWETKQPNEVGPSIAQKATPEELTNIVGKEAAKKLLETKPDEKGMHVLNNADLKIGGEGMKGFYDQIIPKALEKISGEKVKSAELSPKYKMIEIPENPGQYVVLKNDKAYHSFINKSEAEAILEKHKAEKGDQVHYIDLSPALKDKALGKGFPLFSSTHIYTPIAGNPFESKDK